MSEGISIIERAYELARSGTCATPDDVRKSLEGEGYEGVRLHLQGAAIKRELRRLCDIGKAKRVLVSAEAG